jgi:hypothetical protein
MKLQKVANLLFIVFFLGFLFVGTFATVTRPPETVSFYENRTLAVIPDFNQEKFLNGSWFSAWETYLKDHAAGRSTLLKAGTYIDLAVLRRPVVNEVVAADGLLLGYNEFETVDPAAIEEKSNKMADDMAALRDLVGSYGGNFLYVTVPGQYTYFSDRYPPFLNNRSKYTEAELSSFTRAMADRKVPLLDMGLIFGALGNPAEMYSTADYHYTFYGAYETYRAIIDRLNSDDKLNLVLTEKNDLNFTVLENPWLGSRERKLFALVSTGEKAVIGTLKKDIPFTLTDNGNLTAPSVYALPQSSSGQIAYTIYMGGDMAETILRTNRPALPDILIVGDSFTNPVECLIYTSFDEMRSLDLRYYHQQSLADYVRTYRPDVVVMIRDYEVLLSEDGNGTVLEPSK